MERMNNTTYRLDLLKLVRFLLKYVWIVIICAAVGFGFMYQRAAARPDSYTAYGTMYVVNANPNQVNYGYVSTTDLSSAVQLIETYSVVVRSESVLGQVLTYELDVTGLDGKSTGEKIMLSQKYPELTTGRISGSISMVSVNETGMVRVICTTNRPDMAMDICNAVLAVAPKAIIDVVGAGNAQMVDSATMPIGPNPRGERRQGLIGAAAGGLLAAALLVLICLLRQRVMTASELSDRYKPPILSSIRRSRGGEKDPGSFLLNADSNMEMAESYSKLRINLLYCLAEKQNHVVEVTSALSGEGKSTITANLGISCAMSGKQVLIVDADMRRACQRDIFHYDPEHPGLSDVLAGEYRWKQAVMETGYPMLSLLPAGHMAANPSQLLESAAMKDLLTKLSEEYDLVLLDVPPINIVADPLTLSQEVAGSVFVVRQGYSSHREIRKALISAEMTGMRVLGFVFYGEKVTQGDYASRSRYRDYYNKYNASQRERGYEQNRYAARQAEWQTGPDAETPRRRQTGRNDYGARQTDWQTGPDAELPRRRRLQGARQEDQPERWDNAPDYRAGRNRNRPRRK